MKNQQFTNYYVTKIFYNVSKNKQNVTCSNNIMISVTSLSKVCILFRKTET